MQYSKNTMAKKFALISKATHEIPNKLYTVENGFDHVLRDLGSQVSSPVP